MSLLQVIARVQPILDLHLKHTDIADLLRKIGDY